MSTSAETPLKPRFQPEAGNSCSWRLRRQQERQSLNDGHSQRGNLKAVSTNHIRHLQKLKMRYPEPL
ncbi:MAG: hypothetical protein V7L22_22240 [Nostoc sp.]|uniref:hypothetical protein n=1 Tax=Nostoc sp. TaxID=1180 RepID=UPI002FF83D7B